MLSPVSRRALAALRERTTEQAQSSGHGAAEGDAGEEEVEEELFRPQVETGTRPCHDLDELDDELRRCRRLAAEAAEASGAVLLAVPTPVLADQEADATDKPRYQRIVEEFGQMGRSAVASGMHVHVDVADDDEGVAVLDRLRPWLPVLLALSANSPFAWGVDTAYASWRSQVWGRWPTAGQTEPFGDAAAYHAATEALIATGAAIDRGMLYLDARLSASYPTVEIRIADVCTEVENATLVAALARALVETAARSTAAGEALTPWRTDLVRAATWRAARFGLEDQLVHPVEQRLAPARTVVEAVFRHTQAALEDAGDLQRVRDLFEQLASRGSGAARQRAVAEASGSLVAVVDDVRDRTRQSHSDR
jgi:carboxylate-amine ligase